MMCIVQPFPLPSILSTPPPPPPPPSSLLVTWQLHKGIETDEKRIEKLSLQIRELQGRVAERQAEQREVEGLVVKLRKLGEEMRVKEGRREVLQRQKEQQYNDIEIEVEGMFMTRCGGAWSLVSVHSGGVLEWRH